MLPKRKEARQTAFWLKEVRERRETMSQAETVDWRLELDQLRSSLAYLDRWAWRTWEFAVQIQETAKAAMELAEAAAVVAMENRPRAGGDQNPGDRHPAAMAKALPKRRKGKRLKKKASSSATAEPMEQPRKPRKRRRKGGGTTCGSKGAHGHVKPTVTD